MKFDPQKTQKVPLRYRLIALGFMKGDGVQEVNDRLMEQGCMPLYARSYLEAGLIYAFSHGLSYEEWQELLEICEPMRRAEKEKSAYFQGTTVSYQELKQYVSDNSAGDRDEFATRALTRVLEEEICRMSGDREAFQKYFLDNLSCFSAVREKTRYYFCKYMYYFLSDKIERFVSLTGKRVPRGEDFEILKGLKGLTPLKRRQRDPGQTKEFLTVCDISCGEIFEMFNHFYFDYVSNDWVEVLSECLTDMSRLSRQNKELIEQREKQEMQNEKKKNRLGETMIRRFIRGDLDLDRSTLISMLLFFSDGFQNDARRMDRERLDTILDECGFSMLRARDTFDRFILSYLDAEDRTEYLMKEAENQALHGENFYLYHVYQGAESQAKLLEKWLK